MKRKEKKTNNIEKRKEDRNTYIDTIFNAVLIYSKKKEFFPTYYDMNKVSIGMNIN